MIWRPTKRSCTTTCSLAVLRCCCLSLKDQVQGPTRRGSRLVVPRDCRRGWYRRRPDAQRLRWAGIGVFVLIVGTALTAALAFGTSWGLVGLVVVLAVLVGDWISQDAVVRTGAGSAMHRRILGFREMFLAGEGDRQAWAEQQNLFSRYLPYAIVFGCTEKWAETFSSLAAAGLVPQDSLVWWSSPRPFDWIIFS